MYGEINHIFTKYVEVKLKLNRVTTAAVLSNGRGLLNTTKKWKK